MPASFAASMTSWSRIDPPGCITEVIPIFAAASILTPPDPVTQIGLAIPLLFLYELSILSVKLIEKKSKEKNAQY